MALLWTMDLSGEWELGLDPEDIGDQEGWATQPLPARIKLPGSLTEQGIGDEVGLHTRFTLDLPPEPAFYTADTYAPYRRSGEVKFPYWLTPKKVFVGAAWYRRSVEVPLGASQGRVVLYLERPHWGTRVYIDGEAVPGEEDSLAVPHEHDLTGYLTPGRHTLTLRVDNRMIVNVGPNSHSVSDHTQGNWNGVVGRVELRGLPGLGLERAVISTSANPRSVSVSGQVRNDTRKTGRGRIEVNLGGLAHVSTEIAWGPDGGSYEQTVQAPESMAQWDEFSPALHTLSVTLTDSVSRVLDTCSVQIGFRDVARNGRQLTINGRPAFLRGTLECCIFPLTGYPPTDPDPWVRIMRVVRDFGLNHIRFHSYCPPEAAFVAADEAGVYLQVECSSWPNQGATVGDGSSTDGFLYREAWRIIRGYGHHPSFCFLAAGNEPAGANHVEFLSNWVTYWRQHDPMRMHTTAAGWPVVPESDFHSTHDPRIQRWGDGLASRINAEPPTTVADYTSFVQRHDRPLVSHEIGQWCAFPNLGEIGKYTGVFRARNYELLQDRMQNLGLSAWAAPFLHASGKLQVLCYKEDIESALRTAEFGGFQLLDLHDFPGQGTATVGVLDAFWEEKGYVTAEEFRRFNGPTVLLARLPGRTFVQGQTIRFPVDVAHYGSSAYQREHVRVTLSDSRGVTVFEAESVIDHLKIGFNPAVIVAQVDTAALLAPDKYVIRASLTGRECENTWDLWVYPAEAADGDARVCVTGSLDDAIETAIRGKAVLLVASKEQLAGEIELGFSTIFWNTAWTQNQPPHTMGIVCDPGHPALAGFPTEGHSNWQWWELLHDAGALHLDLLGEQIEPIVRVVGDWNRIRSLGLTIEFRIGSGRLMVTGSNLLDECNSRSAARQMRRSLVNYLKTSLPPEAQLTPEQVRRLFR